jgi:hypothetical protein
MAVRYAGSAATQKRFAVADWPKAVKLGTKDPYSRYNASSAVPSRRAVFSNTMVEPGDVVPSDGPPPSAAILASKLNDNRF